MTESLECYRCNATMTWEGDVPDDESDRICTPCLWVERDALQALVAELKAIMRWRRDRFEDIVDDATVLLEHDHCDTVIAPLILGIRTVAENEVRAFDAATASVCTCSTDAINMCPACRAAKAALRTETAAPRCSSCGSIFECSFCRIMGTETGSTER